MRQCHLLNNRGRESATHASLLKRERILNSSRRLIFAAPVKTSRGQSRTRTFVKTLDSITTAERIRAQREAHNGETKINLDKGYIKPGRWCKKRKASAESLLAAIHRNRRR